LTEQPRPPILTGAEALELAAGVLGLAWSARTKRGASVAGARLRRSARQIGVRAVKRQRGTFGDCAPAQPENAL
jgi:hypothetical protein